MNEIDTLRDLVKFNTIKDKEASQYANIPFIYASYGFGKVDNYDYKIDNISDLLHIF